MAKANLAPIIEFMIDHNPDLKEYITNNTINNFKVDDIVKCTFFKGLYKVLGTSDNKVIITKIDYSGDLEYVSPRYLLNISDVNKESMEILYGG